VSSPNYLTIAFSRKTMDEDAHVVGNTKYLAQVLRSMSEDFQEKYGFPLDSMDQFSDNNVENYVRGNLNLGVIKEEAKLAYLEMAPPNKMPATPGVKLATPMATYRQYVDEFEASCPYDEQNDRLATTSLAKDIATHVGAVVFNENSVDKPHKPVYQACAQFINKLEGNILVVGDVNGAVTIKLKKDKKVKVLPVNECWTAESYSWLKDREKFRMEWEELSTSFDKMHYDHIVYLFKGINEPEIVERNSKVHYLDFIPGKFMVEEKPGKYMYKGKNLTVYPKRGNNGVPHTVLFGHNAHPINYQVIWWTYEVPEEVSPSMIPLSPQNGIGWPQNLMCSEKKDGDPAMIIMKNGRGKLIDKDKSVETFDYEGEVNQVLLCEQIEDKIYVLEPACTDSNTFGEWLETQSRRRPFRVGNFKILFKDWFSVTESRVKQFMSYENEGVCFKRKNDRIGQMDPIFRKISTFYVKNPERASYEDYVYHVRKGIIRGMHSFYEDPNGIYNGEGVYEVKANYPYSLIRKRKKDRADPAWYVDIVKMKFNYHQFLVETNKEMFEIAQDHKGGLVHLSRKESTIAKDTNVVKSGLNTIIYRTGFHFAVGHRIYALGKEWKVSLKRENNTLQGIYDYHCVLDRGQVRELRQSI